jgi:hypothetical protein
LGELIVSVEDADLVDEMETRYTEISDSIREQFRKGDADGLKRLAQSCVAMLGQERFQPYLVRLQ